MPTQACVRRVCRAVPCLVVVRDEEHERVARHAGRCNDPMQRRLRPTAAALPSDTVSSARAPSDRECTEWRHRAAMQRDAMRCIAMQCDAMQFYAMRCIAMQFYAMRCIAMRCIAMRCGCGCGMMDRACDGRWTAEASARTGRKPLVQCSSMSPTSSTSRGAPALSSATSAITHSPVLLCTCEEQRVLGSPRTNGVLYVSTRQSSY